VDRSHDKRPIRIAVQEVDDDLVADAGEEQGAERAPRPGLAHADPARAMRVAQALAVPMELDLHAAVLVGVDLFTWRPHDDRRLDTVDPRPGRASQRAEGDRRRDDLEAVRIRRPVGGLGIVGVRHPRAVLDAQDEVLPGEVRAWVAVEREPPAGHEARAVALALAAPPRGLERLEPHPGSLYAHLEVLVGSGILVNLEIGVCVGVGRGLEREGRLSEVVIPKRHLARLNLVDGAKPADLLPPDQGAHGRLSASPSAATVELPMKTSASFAGGCTNAPPIGTCGQNAIPAVPACARGRPEIITVAPT
jgi:hypothetical protein